ETAKNLISIYFAKNAVEKRAAGLARKAEPIGTVGVLGAGFMGAGIAQVLAARGERVVLKDRDLASVGRGYAFCRGQRWERVARRRMRELEVKHKVLAEVEAVAPESLIFASNTSAIPIARIAAGSRRPERVVGMHF